MKVLFVGATGLIGRAIVPQLASEFELQLTGYEEGEVGGLPARGLDIRDFEATAAMVRESGPDAIVNCAIADYHDYVATPTPEVVHRYNESMIDVNMRGSYHLYEAAQQAGVGKFVFISSMYVVAGAPHYENIVGGETARPVNFYACTKNFGEQLGALYAMRFGTTVTALRIGQPYPLHNGKEEERLSQEWYRALLVHFEDIARAVRCALHRQGGYAAYPIVSSSDVAWVDQASTQELGYVPAYHFTPGGAVPRT